MVRYEFHEWQFTEFKRKGGHMMVEVPVLIDGDVEISSANLVFDTGAYVTVVSRPTARRLKLPLGSGKPATLQGFSKRHDPIPGELLEIPCIVLGKHFIYNVKTVVPLDNVAVSEVLGENVLEYLNYVVDHRKNVIYVQVNPEPKPYIDAEKGIDMSCGKVLLAND